MGDDEEPTVVGGDVFWEPIRFSAEEIETIEANLPDGSRVKPVYLLGGRRLGFDEPLPPGTRISKSGRVMWVVTANN